MTDPEWQKAKEHFDKVRHAYQELEGLASVNTTMALRMVFDPLAKRYNNRERTEALYDEMLAVE